jgi:hypothetical protein
LYENKKLKKMDLEVLTEKEYIKEANIKEGRGMI